MNKLYKAYYKSKKTIDNSTWIYGTITDNGSGKYHFIADNLTINKIISKADFIKDEGSKPSMHIKLWPHLYKQGKLINDPYKSRIDKLLKKTSYTEELFKEWANK